MYQVPYDDRKYRDSEAPTIVDVARTMETTPVRVRKALITAGYFSTETSRRVVALYNKGYSTREIAKKTSLSIASVHSYTPYSKGVYNLEECSVDADIVRLVTKRKKAVKKLKENIDDEQCLWEAIEAFAGYPFKTANGLPLKYEVRCNTLYFNRRKTGICRGDVISAFRKAQELQKTCGCVSGPKKLGTCGASCLYPVFLRIGICCGKEP